MNATGRRSYKRSRGQKATLGAQEKRRLLQLAGCILLFLMVFFAKGIDKFDQLRFELAQILQTDVNFKEVFSNLGWSVASGRPAGKILNELWVDVFLPYEDDSLSVFQEGPLYQEVKETFGVPEPSWVVKPFLPPNTSEAAEIIPPAENTEDEPTPSEPVSEIESEPDVIHVDYSGPALPDNTTMDKYRLGLSEIVTPVSAELTSPFGWREHPISGGEKFHCGVDLGVETGTDILAFASGTVDYIGESDVYGLYLQLRHDNGVTSFYAHCSELCVQQGQTVLAGEKVAESGATGDVTGPHLHFEMKKDGIRLNPAYYIEILA